MSQLHQMLQQNHRVAVSAIAGMGGVGKTELALQYALKYQPTYPAGICWLSARGVDVGTQIVQFGRSLLDLNPPEDVELVEQVTFCWRHWQSGEVLLVFDDVTDYAAIKPYLPPSNAPRFKVLITTRLRLGASVNRLELEVLDEAAALALLEPLVGSDRIQLEQDCTQQLCTQLGYLPLGLELVGRYLARKPDLSLAVMLQRLQSKRLAALALCQTDDDMTARSGVAAAFELSWEVLSESAKPLGYLLSLFATAPIPWSLVEQCLADQDPETLEETRDSELLNLHLLQRTNPGTYRLHPLIRDFFQTKLAQSQHPDALKQRFCPAMATVARQVRERPTRQQILAIAPVIPHVAEVATLLQDWLSNDDLIAPYMGLGRFYKGQGAYAQAEPWYDQCRLVSQTRLGADHPVVAISLDDLATLYQEQGRYNEAEPLFQRSLAISEQQLGADHPMWQLVLTIWHYFIITRDAIARQNRSFNEHW
jgi:tetratricopeptide (TPR) repeat protein